MNELQRYFKEHHIRTAVVARKTGYSVAYIRNLLNGSDVLNDRARFRLLLAFPELRPVLLPVAESTPESADIAA